MAIGSGIDYTGLADFVKSAPFLAQNDWAVKGLDEGWLNTSQIAKLASGEWAADDSVKQGLGGFIGPTTTNTATDSDSWGLGGMFGKDGWLGSNVMDVVGTLGQIGSGIANYFNGQKMLGLAQDQFNFQKALANRNMQNQAKIINNQYDSSAEVAAAMAGRRGTTSDETINRYRNNASSKHVNSDWIG